MSGRRQSHAACAVQEGYALAWSPAAQGWLASGDCAGNVTLLEPSAAGKWTPSQPLQVCLLLWQLHGHLAQAVSGTA